MEAADELGFHVVELHANPMYFNMERIERTMQQCFMDLGVGRRLWRKCMGCPKKDSPRERPVVKLYLTFSFDVLAKTAASVPSRKRVKIVR